MLTEQWRRYYNQERPHSSLGYQLLPKAPQPRFGNILRRPGAFAEEAAAGTKPKSPAHHPWAWTYRSYLTVPTCSRLPTCLKNLVTWGSTRSLRMLAPGWVRPGKETKVALGIWLPHLLAPW